MIFGRQRTRDRINFVVVVVVFRYFRYNDKCYQHRGIHLVHSWSLPQGADVNFESVFWPSHVVTDNRWQLEW